MAARARGRGRLARGAALAVGGLVAYRAARGPRPVPALPPALSGERIEVEGRAGRLSYYVAGTGAPLLLVHSINAAGSAYEVGPIFEALRRGRRVYAVDLPGFGSSDRSDRRYEVTLYVDAIHDMLDVVARDGPVDALALSLSSEFLARAALERPDAFRSLAFVTPTGFGRATNIGGRVASGSSGGADATREIPGLHAVLSLPLWSERLWSALVSRASIRYFQPGARHAPLAFVSGRLFSADPGALYRRLAGPVLMTQAVRGDFGDFSGAGWTRERPNWRVETFETGALPHFEMPERFAAIYEAFLVTPPG